MWISKKKYEKIIARLDELEDATSQLERELNALRSASVERVIAAIDAEPEFPGQMPDEMWAAINGDRDAIEEAMRIAVRQTKQGIKERLGVTTDSRSTPEVSSQAGEPSGPGVSPTSTRSTNGSR